MSATYIDTDRLREFQDELRFLCVRLGLRITEFRARERDDAYPQIEVEITQLPPPKETS